MIRIIAKPTDTPDDNSTGAVAEALRRLDADVAYLSLEELDPLGREIKNDLIWVCGIRQDIAYFEMLNVLALDNLVINSPDAIALCASKARTTAALLREGIPTPETVFTASRETAEAFLRRQGRLVYKPLYGFDGNGIFPFTRMDELGGPPYYLQEYVENDRDYRVFVIDGEAVGAIERRSDSFAHNIHQGGSGRPYAISPEMGEIAGAAARAVNIDYCGVDLLPTPDGFTVLEVNGTPNWHCMGVPIPRFVAEYLVRRHVEYRRA
jgi:tetrahydromethanopterin:alpha-L-glutamate ligase